MTINMTVDTKPPYGRLSIFYFVYFLALAVFMPFWPSFLTQQLGFSAEQLGQVMAVYTAMRIVAPVSGGWLADYLGKRLSIIRWSTFLTFMCFSTLYFQQRFWWVMVVMASLGFFWNVTLPQFEALTLMQLGKAVQRYSQVRLWGSISFIVVVVTLPWLLDKTSYLAQEHPQLVLITIMQLALVASWLVTWLIRDRTPLTHTHKQSSLREVMRQPVVWLLLAAFTLQQGSHGAYYNFYTIYLTKNGYSQQFIGWMWALGVIAEVLMFLALHRLMHRFRAEKLFVFAVLLTVVRWILLANGVKFLPLLLFIQLFHAVTYGLFHASAMQLIYHVFPGKLQGRGQALYTMTNGIGGILGSLVSGYSWEPLGAPVTFYLCALMAMVGFFCSVWAMPRLKEIYA